MHLKISVLHWSDDDNAASKIKPGTSTIHDRCTVERCRSAVIVNRGVSLRIINNRFKVCFSTIKPIEIPKVESSDRAFIDRSA